MQYRHLQLVDLDAAGQQLIVKGAAGVQHQAVVGDAGQHQAHVDAAAGGGDQGVDDLLVGDKVCAGDVDGFFRFADCQHQRFVDFKALVRIAGEHPHNLVADRRQDGEVVCLGQFAGILVHPVVHERVLESRHRRSLDFHVGIAPADFFGIDLGRTAARAEEGAVGVVAADVDAARKSDAAVDHQQLAVVAVVHFPLADPGHRVDGIEGQQVDAARFHPLEKGLRHAEGADAVVEYVDGHALAALFDQQVGELHAQFVLVEDIGFQVDGGLGVAHGGHHFLHGGRAVDQQGHLVAGD